MNAVETAFDFVTVSYLTRIGNQSAGTLTELLTGLEHCSDASIFHHTFQTLGSHHFLTEGFSNDFAQWVLADTNRNDLAEQLAALDIRDYVSIAALRRDLCRLVGEFCTAYPSGRLRRAPWRGRNRRAARACQTVARTQHRDDQCHRHWRGRSGNPQSPGTSRGRAGPPFQMGRDDRRRRFL